MALLAVLVLGTAGWFAVTALGASGPPTPTLTPSPSANPTNSTSMSFTFSSSGATSYQCKLDTGSFGLCSSPKPYSGLPAGPHTFQVYAVAGGKSSGTASYSWTIDTTAPTVLSITRLDASPSKANPLRFTVTFSEPVSGVSVGNFAAVKGAGVTGTPTVGTPTPNGGAAPRASWTVPVGTAGLTGSGAVNSTVGLNLANASGIKDAANNTLATSSFTGDTYIFDTTGPTVVSITRAGVSPTKASSVSWTVTFSEPVTGGGTGNFSLVQSGLTGSPAVTGVSGSGAARTVTASTGSGTPANGSAGTLQLNLTSVGGIADLATNGLSGTFSGSGAVYQIDRFAPVPVLDSFPPNPNSVSTSTFTWHDGEPSVTYLCSVENGSFSSTVQGADGPPQPCASPLTYVVMTTNNGMHQFGVKAVDALGNVSSSVTYSWKVDKGSIQNFTIDGNATGLLYPGASAATPIAATFHNPNNFPIYVTSLTVGKHVADFPAGCNSGDFVITQASIPAAGVQVPAKGQVTLPAQGATAPTVLMQDNGDQTPCRNLNFHFDYGGSAHS